jgi:TM2 domain-containing membrane protein YozV
VSKRIKDAAEIERRLLELAYTTDAKITAPALAYLVPCSIDDAAAVLDQLAAADRVTMEIEDDGAIVYTLPGRQRLAAPPPPALTPAIATYTRARSLERWPRPPRAASPLAAVLLTFLIPGAGHLYAGRVAAAVMWFLVVGMGYALILPGLVLHLFSMASAARAARELNAIAAPRQLALAGAY